MHVYAIIADKAAEAAKFIREGRIVAVPTGTAYALACDALQGHALQRLRILKQRPQEKTFTVFIRPELISRYFEMSPEEQALWEKYQGQPLTLLLKPKTALEHLGQVGLPTEGPAKVGLRMIDHPLMRELAEAVDVPLTATSANVSGQPAAYSPQEIVKQFPGVQPDGTTYNLSLAAILDGGQLPQNPPTTIAKIKNGKIEIVRQGALQLK